MTITILNIERVAKGGVAALASVELEVAGVVIVLQALLSPSKDAAARLSFAIRALLIGCLPSGCPAACPLP